MEDVTRINARDLMQRSDECISQRGFVLHQMAMLDVEMQEMERRLAGMKYQMSEGTKWELEASLCANPDTIPLIRRKDELEGTRDALGALAETLESKINLFSRELTRRTSEMHDNKR